GRHVTTIVSQLRDAGLAGAEVWVTQANVNSDFPTQSDPPSPDGTPVSGNMQSVPFVVDRRGTSAFYAAWQPYMFSQIGRSGAAALFHWGYTGGQNPDGGGVSLDTQNGEVSYADDGGTKYLSYWVDSTLARTYGRQPSAPAQTILPSWVTDGSQSVDVLATRTTDGSTLVMVSNIATTADAGAPNGPGQPRSVIVDLAPLGAGATSAWVLQVDADTSLAAGPACAPITVGVDQRVLLTFGGYGMAVLTIASAQDAGAPQSGPCASP
ncbi:MAG TPA: hypothetical protein VE987_00040, partial [Polyangiaceae bacterium]|nr:hypothetical protein [Polyangiaceae bacterium]